ncbi:MAG TPA: EcsC family protein [Ignavibacteria bacterium]|nr:EcsC family protein [Ignavibacteria bacterium]HMR41816.1 EcsC family protein [Ignavibacteria bacterium]
MTDQDLEKLREAKRLLENPSFLMELSNIVGKPVEMIYTFLPEKFQKGMGDIARKVLLKSLDILVSKMDKRMDMKPNNFFHKMLVTGTGTAGGFFGLASLSVELPVTTTIMLRSIADIARSKGFDINDTETKLACLEVFALGGNSKRDDFSDSAYYITRGALASAVTEANKYLLQKGMIKESAPALVNFISKIASRFGIMISEGAAAKSIPVIGAASGGAINLVFMNHFQRMAEGHFTVMQLENIYGEEKVMEVYKSL